MQFRLTARGLSNTTVITCLTFVSIIVGILTVTHRVGADEKPELLNPIEARQHMMENARFAAFAAAMMVKGKRPYDAKKAELAMRTINAVALGLGDKFPVNSKTGFETEAKALIWTNRSEFQHLVHELIEHSEKGIKAAKEGPDAFKIEYLAVKKYCKQCHEKFREDK